MLYVGNTCTTHAMCTNPITSVGRQPPAWPPNQSETGYTQYLQDKFRMNFLTVQSILRLQIYNVSD